MARIVVAYPAISAADFDWIQQYRKRNDASRIVFEVKVATINRDLTGAYYHEFLVPHTGYAALVKLHDALYARVLAPHLRLDIDFIPHIGIGNTEDPLAAKRNVDALNARGVHIAGTIAALDIVEYEDGRIQPIERVELRPSA